MIFNEELYTKLNTLYKEKKFLESYEIIKGINMEEVQESSHIELICEILGEIVEQVVGRDSSRSIYGKDVALQDELFDIVMKYYDTTIKNNPAHTSNYVRKAKLFVKMNQHEEALQCYQEGINNNPDAYELYVESGILCDSMGKLNEAEEYYKRAIEINPENPWAYAKIGDNLSNQKRSREAIGRYLKAIELDSKYDYALSHLGYVYEQKGDYDEAIRCYQEAVKWNGKYDWAMGRLAETYLRLGDEKNARKWFLKALEVNPEDSWYLCGVGYIDEKKEDFGSAISFYKKALEDEESRNHKWILVHTGICYSKIYNKEQAIEYLKRAIQVDANYDDVFKKLVEIFIERKAVDEGIAMFNGFIVDNLCSPLIYSYLGLMYKLKGELDKAIEVYEVGIEKFPKNYLLYHRRGEADQEQGNVDSAIESFKKAIELNPDFAEAYYRLSLAYSVSNKLEEAEKSLKRAVELAPEELWLLYYTISFYEAIKKIDKAEEVFATILKIRDYDQQSIVDYIRFCLRNFLLQKGFEQIQRCLEKNPNNKEVKAELVRYYTLVQSRVQAIQTAKELIKEDPEFLIAYQYYALVYENANPQQAIRILSKASQIKEDKWVLDRLGRLNLKINRYKTAVGYFKRSLSIAPNDPYTLALIGNAYVFLRKYEEAIPYLERSLSHLRFYPLSYTHYYLANCYYKLDKSIESLKKAEGLIKERLELVKKGVAYSKYESFRLFSLLGEIKQRSGNYPEAKIAYSQASKYIFDAPLGAILSLPIKRLFCSIKERFFSKTFDE